ncbi:MAG: UpxY family transcription antiterminator [Rikenellaceae bacterium]|nr:UpxY family transcription antiterminator [Rikenellaceae bacterium]
MSELEKSVPLNWFVLYTAARAEKKVEMRIREMGVEVYLPIHRIRRKWSDRMKIVELPLFNSYVFVRCTEFQLRKLPLVYGVARIVYYLQRPAVVRDEEIVAIREFLKIAEDKEVIYEGDHVEIVAGALREKSGKVLKVDKNRVTLFLEELGAKIYVSLSEVNKLNKD